MITAQHEQHSQPAMVARLCGAALAALVALPDLASAAADIRIGVTDLRDVTVEYSFGQVVIELNENTVADVSGLLAAAPTTARQNGKVRHTIKVAADETAVIKQDSNAKTVSITIASSAATAVAGGTTKAADKPGAEAKDAADKIAQLIKDGREDLGVPSSPALSLIGVDPAKATHPKTPKDLAAALVQGRGADGKIKAGVAIDASLAQLVSALTPGNQPSTPAAATHVDGAPTVTDPGTPAMARAARLTPTVQAHYQAVLDRRTPSGAASVLQSVAKLVNSDESDTSHRLIERIKLSVATTEDQQSTDKKGVDLAYGAHYVFFDYSDPLTSKCDGSNRTLDYVQAAVKELIAKKHGQPPAGLVTPAMLRQLLTNSYPDVALKAEELAPVLAACSLTAAERLNASAAMIGAAQAYKLMDGTWSNRQSGGKGIWATYVSPGFPGNRDLAVQAIVHARATRGLRVADPADSSKSVLQDANLVSLRLRAAGERGAGSLEFSQSKNTVAGKSETVRRQALGLEWKLADGIWLVGSGGMEKSSLGTSRSTPFVVTNLRFGGSPAVPAAFPSP